MEENISRYNRRNKKKYHKRTNYDIKAPKVRLVHPDEGSLGIIPTQEAINKAKKYGQDLVEVAPDAKPPVCKIMDYSKYLYHQKKKAKKAQKQTASQLKEIQFRPNIDDHDYSFKMKHIQDFLDKGHKVKVVVRFRGREMAHQELGHEIIDRLKEDLKDYGSFEKKPTMEGRFLIGYMTSN